MSGERRGREEWEIILNGYSSSLEGDLVNFSLDTPGCTDAKFTSPHKASPLEPIIKLYTVLIVTYVSLQTKT